MRLHGAEQLHDKAQRASRNQVPCCVLHDVLQRFQTAAKATRIWRRRIDRPLASDPNNHLVQMPSIARARAATPQPPRDQRAELQHPAPDGFVGDIEPTLGQQILDVSVAEREAQVEPDRMLDDNGRKPVTTV